MGAGDPGCRPVPLRDVARCPTPRVLDGWSTIRVRLFGTLASVAFALAVIRIYGILSYQVSQRRRRPRFAALGGSWPPVLGGVVRSGLVLTVAGVTAATLASLLPAVHAARG
jgi:hypothetical protein